MYFLTLDKNFILDNFSFVQDKKYFVRAEGRGKSVEMRVNTLITEKLKLQHSKKFSFVAVGKTTVFGNLNMFIGV